MTRRLCLLLCFVGLGFAAASAVTAQTTLHSDGGGYTVRSPDGQQTYSYRFGTGATYYRTGNLAFYRDNTGTSGTSVYGAYGRYDRFQNSREGWTGSGYTPNVTPELSTYQRFYGVTPPTEVSAQSGVSGRSQYPLGSYHSDRDVWSPPTKSSSSRKYIKYVVFVLLGLAWVGYRSEATKAKVPKSSGPPVEPQA